MVEKPREADGEPAAMRIGDRVIFEGHVFVLVGHDPMSVPERRAQLEDPETGERSEVAYDDLEAAQGFDAEA